MIIIIDISGLIFLFSCFVMAAYLLRVKVYTMSQLRLNLLWPRIIFEYRDHTKKNFGKIGIWYYVSAISFSIFIFSIVAANIRHLFLLPTPIIVLITIAGVFIISAIGYVIYGLSKDKYF